MKAKKLIAAGIAASMSLLTLAGCGTAGNTGNSGGDTAKEDTVKEDTAKKDTDEEDTGSVYFLNFKSELSAEWEEVAGSFTKETGINMKVVTAGSGTYEQTLKSELSKKEMPTLFNVNGPIGYQTWKDYCADLKDSQIYEWLTDKDMAITDGDGVYAIPYAVEGYGIIYNDAIMKKYFALPDKAVDISDKEFSLKDFKGKYVCLYLWPCVSPAIQQFAELKKLQPLFKKKNIVLVNLSIENKKDNWVQTIQNEEVQVGTHLYAGFDKHFLQKCHYSAASMVQFIFIDPAGKIIELQAPLQSSNMEDFIKETIQD